MSRSLLTDVTQARLMSEALHSVLQVLNPLGVEIVMNTLDRACGVVCTEHASSSKEEIEDALLQVLGKEAGDVVIREWNKKMQ